jgi:hypothetical protein
VFKKAEEGFAAFLMHCPAFSENALKECPKRPSVPDAPLLQVVNIGMPTLGRQFHLEWDSASSRQSVYAGW